MFQGLKELRLRNWAEPPVPPASIDAVVLTHAHLDHCGMLPRLVAQGFKGRIFCTPGTQDLCSLVLPDAGRLQEDEAERANRGGYSQAPAGPPLFTEEQAMATLSRLQPVGYERPMPGRAPASRRSSFQRGHLLGAAYVRMRRTDRTGGTVLFGGDLGRYNRPILPDPAAGSAADVLLVESTYGDRVHPGDDERPSWRRIINDTAGEARQAHHSRLRDRARRGGALRRQEAGGRRKDAGAAGLRRQSDGARGARSSTSGTPANWTTTSPSGAEKCAHSAQRVSRLSPRRRSRRRWSSARARRS